ncbi:MAG: hypothetical protein ABIH11_04555 [Candidatus Altiarchaeota archaeon]
MLREGVHTGRSDASVGEIQPRIIQPGTALFFKFPASSSARMEKSEIVGLSPEGTRDPLEVEEGEAIFVRGSNVKSISASSCTHLILIDPSRRLVGVAHAHPSHHVAALLDEWKRYSTAGDTLAYLVKGDGRPDMREDYARILADHGFKNIYSDFDTPVEGESHPRGDNVTNVMARPDGSVVVERFASMDLTQGGVKYELNRGQSQMMESNLTFDESMAA